MWCCVVKMVCFTYVHICSEVWVYWRWIYMVRINGRLVPAERWREVGERDSSRTRNKKPRKERA